MFCLPESAQACMLYHGTGKTQAEVAEIMAERMRRPASQGQVSKWIKEYRVWAEANNIPVHDPKKLTTITMEPDKINMGTRTDGKDQIKDLAEQLKRELSGIFNWALGGLDKLNASGRFIEPLRALTGWIQAGSGQQVAEIRKA